MKIWKHSAWDAVQLLLSVLQVGITFWLAASWNDASSLQRSAGFVIFTLLTTYNIIVISHLFTHAPWFESRLLNGAVSMLNSFNIGQSVQAYELTHVRNHHRYNNDRKGPDGTTRDTSSTYRDGEDGEHASLFRYAFVGAYASLIDAVRVQWSITRLWRVAENETSLRTLASSMPRRNARELFQIRLDRFAHFAGLVSLAFVSWQWLVFCYLPAYYLSLALVNVQNYYEHYGACPDDRHADSVSHYGSLYNRLTFNDGYHQEHHLRPLLHWTRMPEVRRRHAARLDAVERIVSPVPAIVGFLDRRRRALHRDAASTRS